jgi:tricorn protease-like protein
MRIFGCPHCRLTFDNSPIEELRKYEILICQYCGTLLKYNNRLLSCMNEVDIECLKLNSKTFNVIKECQQQITSINTNKLFTFNREIKPPFIEL